MFAYSSSETVIPTLSFSKAELAYALFVLMKDIPLSNTTTGIELVEVRHYLNQIREQVLISIKDGTLKQAISESIGISAPEKIGKDENKAKQFVPTMEDLKKQFPSLSESEITDIIETARKEQRKNEEVDKKNNAPPPVPSFRIKPKAEGTVFSAPESVKNPSDTWKGIDEAEKFARLLGSF